MKVVITRPRAQAQAFAAALAAEGFEPVLFPVMEIQPLVPNERLERVLAGLGSYAWVVFTSVNGVEVFFQHFRTERPFPVKVAAIGPKTAEALAAHGVTADYVPGEYVAEAILPGLGDLRGRSVLMPRAEGARDALPRAIAAAGGSVDDVAIYRTVPAEVDSEGLANLRLGVQGITFASPSAVRSFVALVRAAGLDPLHLPGHPATACIGPITAAAAEQAGFPSPLVAEEYTVEGLVAVLKRLSEGQP